jgi:predicted SprT family Zn-dependent metalloprotease
MARNSTRYHPPAPPALGELPLIRASDDVAKWLEHYWRKLDLPAEAADRLAVTDSRQEFAVWTGRRLNPLALGCYCYLPLPAADQDDSGEEPELLNAVPAAYGVATALQPALPGMQPSEPARLLQRDDMTSLAPNATTMEYRHLIFIEPTLLPVSTEVTVAHELIHLADRVRGNPRKHKCHGFDSISVDEAALTRRDPEYLRAQLRDETARREEALRSVRPYRYIYVCPSCHREYPRVRRYSRPVSCGRCDQHYNLAFVLQLREERNALSVPATTSAEPTLGDGTNG